MSRMFGKVYTKLLVLNCANLRNEFVVRGSLRHAINNYSIIKSKFTLALVKFTPPYILSMSGLNNNVASFQQACKTTVTRGYLLL